METEDETMAPVFRAMDAARKERKDEREAANRLALDVAGMGNHLVQGKNVLRFTTLGGPVMYYPATNCWQHKGKTGRGDVRQFIRWFKSQVFARPQ